MRPKHRVVLEEVSPRLKGELIHPDRAASIAGIRFSPDGRRIIAGSYPEGTVQFWDAQTGSQLTKIELGYGYQSTFDYFLVSPDWRSLYNWREKRARHKIERDGKELFRWEFDGEIRRWDLETGTLAQLFRQSPARGVRWAGLAPDGRTLMVGEELSGESEGGPRYAVSLLDPGSGEFRELPGKLSLAGTFSGDGNLLAINETDDDSYTKAIKVFDVPTGQLRHACALRDEFSGLGWGAFSPDGALFVASQRTYARRGAWDHWACTLRFFSLDSGEAIAAFPLEQNDTDYGALAFSPDGRTLMATNRRDNQSRLLLFDVPQRRLRHTVVLREEKAILRQPLFSPDGRWIAVATQVIPDELARDDDLLAEDVEQPRIHLVEVATGEVRETLISPQAFTTSSRFSPDGKTLATAGNGRVLLWDLSTPLGEIQP